MGIEKVIIVTLLYTAIAWLVIDDVYRAWFK